MYTIIDIEGNGGGFRKESIIDIAIFKYDGHEIVDQFISLVNPEEDITPFVQKLTGITPKMVKTAPKFHEIARRVVEITEGTTLVGHNIDFDYRMLRQSFKRLGYDFKIPTLDTIPLAQKLIPEAESYSLGKLVKSLGIPLVEHHRAGGDARATLDLFKLLMSKDVNNEIIQKQHEETNAKTYVNKIRELTQDLPNEQGIIYFQDMEGKILLSDFVDDINRFAKKIFNSKAKKFLAVQEKTEQVHYEISGNSLVAQLLMASKGIRRKEALLFGLYHRNGKYFVEKNALRKTEKPLLKFKSFTQGLKALNYIKSREEIIDYERFKTLIALEHRSELWLIAGRTMGERAFLILNNGAVEAYGFYELHTQIQTLSKLNHLKIPVKIATEDFINELKMVLLKGDVKIQPLPQK